MLYCGTLAGRAAEEGSSFCFGLQRVSDDPVAPILSYHLAGLGHLLFDQLIAIGKGRPRLF